MLFACFVLHRYGPGGVSSAVFFDNISVNCCQQQQHPSPNPPSSGGGSFAGIQPSPAASSSSGGGTGGGQSCTPSEHSNSSSSGGSTLYGAPPGADPGTADFWAGSGWPPSTAAAQQHSPLAESGKSSHCNLTHKAQGRLL